jgi:glucose-1-phosphate adenylyltransferase
MIADGSYMDRCHIDSSVVGLRTMIYSGTRITNSVLLGADWYEDLADPTFEQGLGIGRDCILNRVIVDKNARIGDGSRLVNEKGVDHADGDGYFIRSGIIVVPKDGVIKPGTVV